MAEEKQKVLIVEMEPSLFRALKSKAANNGLTIASVVRRLIQKWLRSSGK